MSKILQQGPEIKIPEIQPKHSGKVLTNIENIRAIEEKQKKIEEEVCKKEKRELGKKNFCFLLHVCIYFFSAQERKMARAQKRSKLHVFFLYHTVATVIIFIIVVVGTGRPVRGGKAQEKGEQSLIIIIDYVLVFVDRSLDTSSVPDKG